MILGVFCPQPGEKSAKGLITLSDYYKLELSNYCSCVRRTGLGLTHFLDKEQIERGYSFAKCVKKQ